MARKPKEYKINLNILPPKKEPTGEELKNTKSKIADILIRELAPITNNKLRM